MVRESVAVERGREDVVRGWMGGDGVREGVY